MLHKKPYWLTRMAVSTFALGTVFFGLLVSSSFSEETYANKKGHFSLTLPNGWGVLPEEAMKSFNQGSKVTFDTGFHNNMQEYPYILVMIDARGKAATEEMKQVINGSRTEDNIASLLNELKNAKPDESVYDKKRGSIFVKYAMNAGDGRRVIYAQQMALAKYGGIYIYYYALEKDFDNNLNDFVKIMDSMQLEDSFKNPDLANYSGNEQKYVKNGLDYAAKGDFDKAIQNLNKAVELNPQYSLAYYNRAYVYSEIGKIDNALSDYSKAIECNPKDALAYSNRGKLLFDKYNKLDQAMSDFNKAIEIEPGNGKFYYNRGLLYDVQGNSEAALKDYTKAIELIPSYSDAYNNRGGVYTAQGDLDKAISDYNKSIALDPNSDKAYTGRGAAYIRKGSIEIGMQDLNKAIELSPKNADAYVNRGNAYAYLKNNDASISDLNKAIELNPSVANAHYNLGITYGSIGKFDEAISEYNRELKVNPNNFYAWENRAVTYFYKKDYDNSWKDVNELIARGYKVNPAFVEDLKEKSGRQK